MGGRTRPPYPPEYRAELVRLVREEGRSPSELAREFEPSAGSHTLAEPTEAAGGSRANPANDLPAATASQPHQPVPTYKSAVHNRTSESLSTTQRPPRRANTPRAAPTDTCGCPKWCRGWSGGVS